MAKQVEVLELKKKTREHKVIIFPDHLGNQVIAGEERSMFGEWMRKKGFSD